MKKALLLCGCLLACRSEQDGQAEFSANPGGDQGSVGAGGNASGRGNQASASGSSAGFGGAQQMLTLKQPIDRGDGKLVLELGDTYFEVQPSHGGRVTSLRQSGQELLWLKGADNYADASGSTFWPSPQSWDWPPPAEIDIAPYAASVDPSGIITLEGNKNDATSLKVSKRFSADLAHEAIRLEYTMTNQGAALVSWAPWEITRMPASGVAFWPTGGAPYGDKPLSWQNALGHSWCAASQTQGEAKLFADGAGGFLAYALGDRLLVKRFDDMPASSAAPGEAEVEIYVNPSHDYVEVENQGPYTSIAPGQSVRWQVVWYVRKLPAGVTASVGNADLVAFVAKTLE